MYNYNNNLSKTSIDRWHRSGPVFILVTTNHLILHADIDTGMNPGDHWGARALTTEIGGQLYMPNITCNELFNTGYANKARRLQ